MKSKLSVVLLAVILQTSFAQGEAAIPFLTLQQSPQFLGAAQVGVAVPPIDPMGFYLNPAVLGETSKEFNFTTMFMPSKTEWLGWDNIKFNNFGMSLGYNFENSVLNIPLSVGVGIVSSKLLFEGLAIAEPDSPTPVFITDSYDEFNQFSIGVGYSFYLDFSVGIAFKNFESNIGDHIINGQRRNVKTEGTAIDYGFLVTAPISKLLFNDYHISIKDDYELKPKTSVSLGYSVTNIGDEIEYSYLENQKDPIPRTARLGYNFNLGFDFVGDNIKLNLFDYYFIAEAVDILIEPRDNFGATPNPEINYQSGFGDISFGNQLIQLEGNEKVEVRKAHMFRILETVSFSVGRVNGRSYISNESSGFSVSTSGLAKYLNANFDHDVINFIANHIAIEYYNTSLFSGEYETKIEGIGIIVKNFSF